MLEQPAAVKKIHIRHVWDDGTYGGAMCAVGKGRNSRLTDRRERVTCLACKIALAKQDGSFIGTLRAAPVCPQCTRPMFHHNFGECPERGR